MTRKLFVGIVALLHIILFVYAAWAKLADYTNFQFGLSESPYIASFAGFLAWAVPALEFLIAVLLFLPVTRLAGLYASFLLMLAFTIYIGVMLLSGLEIPCSCGGILEDMSWEVHLVFNSVFVVLSGIAIYLETKHRRTFKHLSYAKRDFSPPGTN